MKCERHANQANVGLQIKEIFTVKISNLFCLKRIDTHSGNLRDDSDRFTRLHVDAVVLWFQCCFYLDFHVKE